MHAVHASNPRPLCIPLLGVQQRHGQRQTAAAAAVAAEAAVAAAAAVAAGRSCWCASADMQWERVAGVSVSGVPT